MKKKTTRIVIISGDNEFVCKLFDRSFLIKNKKNFSIVSFISSFNGIENVKKIFKNTDVYSFRDFEKTNISIFKNPKNEIDKNVLEKNYDIESLSYNFLNYANPGHYNFSLRELKQAYYNALNFSLNFLDYYKPNCVICTDVPHSFQTFIFTRLCEKRKIKVVFKRQLFFPPNSFIFQNSLFKINFLDREKKNNYKYIERKKNKNNAIKYFNGVKNENLKGLNPTLLGKDHFITKSFLMRINFLYLNYIILFFKQAPIHLAKIYIKYFLNLLKIFTTTRSNFKKKMDKINDIEDFLKNKGKLYKDSKTSLVHQDLLFLKGDFIKLSLFKKYNSLTSQTLYKENYLYFPLHYQPEATTYPLGNYFIDQFNAVKILSTHIPKGYYIYVKEHPDTFNLGRTMWTKGNYSRDNNFYDQLISLKNVKLVPMTENIFKLTKNSKAVCTLTGAPGLEGLISGKPVIIFGTAWYENCKEVFKCSTHKDLKQIIRKIRRGVKPNINNVKKFIIKNSIHFYNPMKLDNKNKLRYVRSKLFSQINKTNIII